MRIENAPFLLKTKMLLEVASPHATVQQTKEKCIAATR